MEVINAGEQGVRGHTEALEGLGTLSPRICPQATAAQAPELLLLEGLRSSGEKMEADVCEIWIFSEEIFSLE